MWNQVNYNIVKLLKNEKLQNRERKNIIKLLNWKDFFINSKIPKLQKNIYKKLHTVYTLLVFLIGILSKS